MRVWSVALRRAFLVVMGVGAVLISAASLVYFDLESLPPFAIEKLPVRFETLWLFSLRFHVATALLCFPLCLVLMTRSLQRRPRWHRALGRVAAGGVLLGVVPSGAILAFDAKGGAVVTAGFLLSGAIVGVAMIRGVQTARRRELGAHARAMRHVVAQMSVAVTSRALLVGLDLAGVDPDVSYVFALWAPVLASALVAEVVSRRPPVVARFNPLSLLQRSFREVQALAGFVRARISSGSVSRASR